MLIGLGSRIRAKICQRGILLPHPTESGLEYSLLSRRRDEEAAKDQADSAGPNYLGTVAYRVRAKDALTVHAELKKRLYETAIPFIGSCQWIRPSHPRVTH